MVMRQRHKLVLGAAGITSLLCAAVIIALLFTRHAEAPEHTMAQSDCVSIGSKCYVLETADTDETRQRGLSGRAGLDENTGMLFEFEQPSIGHCFWMKDMKFSIDMIWLDDQKKVVKIESDVLPATYPNSFCPESPAQYVIELDSGEAVAAGLKVNDTVNL